MNETSFAIEAAVLDELIATSKTKCDSLEQQIETLRIDAEAESRVLEALKKKRQQINLSALPVSNNGTVAHSPQNNNQSLPELLAKILAEAGSSLPLPELAKRAEQAGATTTGEKGMAVIVGAALNRRADLFRRVSRGVYALAEHQLFNGNDNGEQS